MNTGVYFVSLLAISLSSIVAATVFTHLEVLSVQLYPLAVLAGGLFPMSAWAYLLFKNKGASQNEIDTVYYFGFLVTLCTLGCAAVFALLTGATPERIEIIGFEFAMGLLATGIGLLARVLLTNRRIATSSPSDALDQYLSKLGRVLVRLEESVVLFERLRDDVVRGASDGAAAISATAIAKVEEELRAPLEGIRSSLSGISVELSGLQSSEALKKLPTQLGKVSKGIEDVAAQLPPLGEGIARVTEGFVENVAINGKLNQSLDSTAHAFGTLSAESSTFSENVEKINQSFGAIASATDHLVKEFSEIDHVVLTGPLKTIGENFSLFDATVKNIAADFSELREVLSSFSNQVEGFSRQEILANVKSIIDQLPNIAAAAKYSLETLKSITESISDAQEQFSPVQRSAIDSMTDLSRELNESAEQLGNAMGSLARALRSAAEEVSVGPA